MYPILRYRNAESYEPESRHPVVQEPNGLKDIPCIQINVKILTGSYVLQISRASFNHNQISLFCQLCNDDEDDETIQPFLHQCASLDHIRQLILIDIQHICENLGIQISQDNRDHLLYLLLDSTAALKKSNPELKPEDYHRLEKQARRLCHALHFEGYKK